MPRNDAKFHEAVERARVIERAVAKWIMDRGARVLPVYDYSGLGENKAPKLQASSASDSLVTPDLLVTRNGATSWCEVKWKSHAFLFRNSNEWETGIDLRLWNQYTQVKKSSGCRVFIVFAHKAENVVTCNEIDDLDHVQGKRTSNWGRVDGHPPMINWPLRSLHVLADYAQIVPSEAA